MAPQRLSPGGKVRPELERCWRSVGKPVPESEEGNFGKRCRLCECYCFCMKDEGKKT